MWILPLPTTSLLILPRLVAYYCLFPLLPLMSIPKSSTINIMHYWLNTLKPTTNRLWSMHTVWGFFTLHATSAHTHIVHKVSLLKPNAKDHLSVPNVKMHHVTYHISNVGVTRTRSGSTNSESSTICATTFFPPIFTVYELRPEGMYTFYYVHGWLLIS